MKNDIPPEINLQKMYQLDAAAVFNFPEIHRTSCLTMWKDGYLWAGEDQWRVSPEILQKRLQAKTSFEKTYGPIHDCVITEEYLRTANDQAEAKISRRDLLDPDGKRAHKVWSDGRVSHWMEEPGLGPIFFAEGGVIDEKDPGENWEECSPGNLLRTLSERMVNHVKLVRKLWNLPVKKIFWKKDGEYVVFKAGETGWAYPNKRQREQIGI